jgi:EmrB/QacA subfamily drug resistance transporter
MQPVSQLHHEMLWGSVSAMKKLTSPVLPTLPAAAGSSSTLPARPRPWQVFVVTSLGAFLVSLDLSIVNVAFPAMARAFPAASRGDLAWVVTAYSIVFGSLLVIGGRTGDRHGLRRVFFAGIGWFSFGSALCGVAPSVALLVAGRAVQGAGAAFLLPSSVGLLLAAVPLEKRSQTVALWGGVGALAVALGPSLGSLLVGGPGWRWAFYVNLPAGALAYVWGRQVLPAAASSASRGVSDRPDYLGAALLSLAVALITLAISKGGERGFGDVRVTLAAALALLLGLGFVVRSARHPVPVLDLELFRSRAFTVANLATFAYAMAFFAVWLGNILFLTAVWGYSIERAGMAVTPGPLVVAVVSGFAGRLAGRVGFRALLVPGSACFAAGLIWFALRVGSEPAYLSEWLPGTLLIGLGIGLTLPVLSAAAVSELPAARFGVGSAVNQTARQVGGAIGVAILVAILGPSDDPGGALRAFDRLWLYAALMAGLSGAIATFLGNARGQATPLPVGD